MVGQETSGSPGPGSPGPGPLGPVSAKTASAAVIGALSIVFWIVIAPHLPKSYTATNIASLTTATTTIVTVLAAWAAREREAYISYWRRRHPGKGN